MVTFTCALAEKSAPEDISATAITFCVCASRIRVEAAAFPLSDVNDR